MAVSTRCKFRVTSVKLLGENIEEIELQTQYDEKLSEEDTAFSNSTPNGSMKFTVTNPYVCGKIKPGESYYVDLVPVPAQ